MAAQEGGDASTPATRLVEIVNADSVAGVVEDGQRVRRLIGNVVLRQEDTRLRAARATQYLDFDVTLFEGDVEIVEAGDTLTARQVRYSSATKIGEAEGDVRIADSSAVLYAPKATYDSRAKVSYFTEGARLVEDDATLTSRRGTYDSRAKLATFTDDVRLADSTTVLTSRRGTYHTETRRADFAGDVRLEHPDTFLEADSLTHFRDVQRSEAHGRVFIERFGAEEPADLGENGAAPEAPAQADSAAARDSTLRTLLFGDRAVHEERRGYSRLDGRPLLVTLRTGSTGATDTLLVRARVLEAYRLSPAALDSMDAAARSASVDGASEGGTIADSVAAVDGEADADRPVQGREDSPAVDSRAVGSLAADSLTTGSPPAFPPPLAPRPSALNLPAGTEITRLVARDSVRIVQPDLVAVADSAVLDRFEIPPPDALTTDSLAADTLTANAAEPVNRDVLRLFAAPSVWAEETQVTGEAMTVLARAAALDTLQVVGRAFAAQRDTALARVNQIRGRTMLALFAPEVQPDSTTANALRRLLVWSNAEAIYFRAKPADAAPQGASPAERLDGAVQMSADSIAFHFRRDSLRAVRVYRGVEGLSYAADIVPGALRLDGYVYTPERRPTQPGLLVPGSREALRLGLPDSLATPAFDIPDVEAARDSVGARLDSLDAERFRLDSLRQDSLQAPLDLRSPPAEVPSRRDAGPGSSDTNPPGVPTRATRRGDGQPSRRRGRRR